MQDMNQTRISYIRCFALYSDNVRIVQGAIIRGNFEQEKFGRFWHHSFLETHNVKKK